MTPTEKYEEQQRALEVERFERIRKALRDDAVIPPEPACFCSSYDTVLRIIFVLALAAVFGLAGAWVVS